MQVAEGGRILRRQRFAVEGIVQGVGFRPFVFQAARRLGIAGWVLNDSAGVIIEAEGPPEKLTAFGRALREEPPPLAVISRIEVTDLPPLGETGFIIRPSDGEPERKAQIAPDTWVCPDCLRELFDPADRRYLYPFINCTNCGPRFSIVTSVPYDRPNTTMSDFVMCATCRDEYADPASRRFHAQPNACRDCGPSLRLLDGSGRPLESSDPLGGAVGLLRRGAILAVKGVGGYHLAVDACNDEAVAELRRRKGRDEKPFALMSLDVEAVEVYACPDDAERRLLTGTERPIVLLRRRVGHGIAPSVAPRSRSFGVMLPYTPLHYLLLRNSFQALVMTSGNLSDEPIAFEDTEAVRRLRGVADGYLVHDRRIHRRIDDSVARLMAGRPLVLRRSRGYVPRGILIPGARSSVLALGAELKNTVCLTREDRAYLSPHIGDLKNPEAYDSLRGTVRHLQDLFAASPRIVAHDLHPDYHSTLFAQELDGPKIPVQHHHAHLASCLAENGTSKKAIGVVFDGLGYGADGHLWGGEFLIGDLAGFFRAGHLDYIPMPGGDVAAREPLRMALSWLFRLFGAELPPLEALSGLSEGDLRLLRRMAERRINSPLTSSCGRLFDAVAALCGLRRITSYEGQAAMELEMAIDDEGAEDGSYPFDLRKDGDVVIVDPAATVTAVVQDVVRGEGTGTVSARFHNGVATMIVEVCSLLREGGGPNLTALSGGVFQNRYLAERAVALLRSAGFEVLTHSLVPPNDGGVSLGQAAVAAQRVEAG